jgi:hypothetical protein
MLAWIKRQDDVECTAELPDSAIGAVETCAGIHRGEYDLRVGPADSGSRLVPRCRRAIAA